MTAKAYYDRRHQPMFFDARQRVLLRLHKGYNIPQAAILGRKPGLQFAGPFDITEKIGRSAYRLEFLSHYKIHDVILVHHLEPAPPMGVFGRRLLYPGEVHLESHTRRLIDEDHHHKRYLLEYMGLGPEYHKWVTLKDLRQEAGELLTDYRLRRPAK